MTRIFAIRDKTKREIYLTKERWQHITQEHPNIDDLEAIKGALAYPDTIRASKYDPNHVRWYYRYNKRLRRYLFVAVKYLNGEGFVITAYYMRSIQ